MVAKLEIPTMHHNLPMFNAPCKYLCNLVNCEHLNTQAAVYLNEDASRSFREHFYNQQYWMVENAILENMRNAEGQGSQDCRLQSVI